MSPPSETMAVNGDAAAHPAATPTAPGTLHTYFKSSTMKGSAQCLTQRLSNAPTVPLMRHQSTATSKPVHPPSPSPPGPPPAAITQVMPGVFPRSQPPGPTCSQRLFALTTGIDARALQIQGDIKFFLFMEMRLEFSWASYQMTPKKWVAATEEYNRRLIEKGGPNIVKKNPQALVRKLGEMEPRLMERIIKGDYNCMCSSPSRCPECPPSLYALTTLATAKRNSSSFWRKHCEAVQLIKVESAPGRKVHDSVFTVVQRHLGRSH